MPGNVNERQTHPPVFCPANIPILPLHPPYPQRVVGLGPDHTGAHGRLTGLAYSLSRFPDSPPLSPAQSASEPRQQGTASPARLHYACQMG
ncbi:hypothetical protein NQZ68_014764 [Dissostichus eleginoides]|nr:hypothetical protein NQZ68_014763 [Dissostichus eleginoides]KAI9534353.1 hypothetical protein NQZ68_014764 [Dissostichus eleginoides]